MAAGAAFLLLAACAPPKDTITLTSPTPSPTTPLAMTGPTFRVGEVGVAYAAVSYSATGGVQPYHWAVSAGALPGGLTLGSDGSISGTPTTSGDFSFTVGVADSGDSSQTATGNISIAAALTAHLRPECASYCNVELGCVSACGNFGTLTGGVGPYTYSVTQGPLPAGTSVSGLSLTGTFSGQSGWLQFTVQVSDALGATTTIAPKFWMYQHISLASGSCIGGFNTGCQTQLPWSGGPSGNMATVSISAVGKYCNPTGCWPVNPPPSGYGLTVSGSSVIVSIPKGLMSGYYAVWTLLLTDANTCSSSAHCQTQGTVTVNVAGG